jgi:hypothetical protein
LDVRHLPFHLELGCYSPTSSDSIGGHLVAIVNGFLVDTSFGQVAEKNPGIQGPPVFVGELLPVGAPLAHSCAFQTPFAKLVYTSRPVSTNYRSSPDWGPSPERQAVIAAIIAQIEGYCRTNGLTLPEAAT